MPATSKAQFRFMAAVEHGGIKKPGLKPSKAKEFTTNVNYKKLPGNAPAPKNTGKGAKTKASTTKKGK